MRKKHARRKSLLPKINSLIKLQSPHPNESRVLIGLFPDNEEGPEFSNGPMAIVVEHKLLNDGEYVPMVLVEGVLGWIFNDEWTAVEGT